MDCWTLTKTSQPQKIIGQVPAARRRLRWFIKTLRWKRNAHHFADDIRKGIFLNDSYVIFHSNFTEVCFQRSISAICQNCSREWLGAKQTTNHHLKQLWPWLLIPHGVTRTPWVNNDRQVAMLWTLFGSEAKELYRNRYWLLFCLRCIFSWWRHQMETFSALLAICAGNSPVTGEFPSQRPVTWSFDVFFEMRLNKRLRKQSRGLWFETPSRSLWRHCNETSKGRWVAIGPTSPICNFGYVWVYDPCFI